MTLEELQAKLRQHVEAFNRAKGVAAQFAAPAPLFAKADGDRGELLIYDTIGGGWFSEGVTAKGVADELRDMKGVKTLDVFINSPGGSVFEGVTIYNELRRFGAKKIVHVDGLAASAASMIAMAGDEIVMAHNGQMMIHDAWGIAIGNADEMRETADVLEKLTNDMVLGSYARTGQKDEQLRAWMKAETWMNAKEAVERGFADIAEEPPKKPERPASKDRAASALLSNPREVEARLRDVLGLSQSDAKTFMSGGYKALAPTRDVDGTALEEVKALHRQLMDAIHGS